MPENWSVTTKKEKERHAAIVEAARAVVKHSQKGDEFILSFDRYGDVITTCRFCDRIQVASADIRIDCENPSCCGRALRALLDEEEGGQDDA